MEVPHGCFERLTIAFHSTSHGFRARETSEILMASGQALISAIFIQHVDQSISPMIRHVQTATDFPVSVLTFRTIHVGHSTASRSL